MYPYYHMHHFHRGPGRFVWFILGGIAATWWFKHKEMRAYERYAGYCVQKPVLPAALPAPGPEMNETSPSQSQNQNAPPRTYWGGNTQAQYEAPRASPPPAAMPFGWNNQQWEEEKERMWAMGRQAGDTMSELSETTLENVLSTVESLKAKVAEHRAEREQQRKLFEQQMQEQKKEPRHYV